MADTPLPFSRYVRIDVGSGCGCAGGAEGGDASAAAQRAAVSAGQAAAAATEAQGSATVALQARDEAIAAAGTALQPGDVGSAAYANVDQFAGAAALAAGTGASMVGIEAPGAGAVLRTQAERNADTVSVKDYGAIGDGVADDTAAFNAALALGTRVEVPAPATAYRLTGSLIFTDGASLEGVGSGSVLDWRSTVSSQLAVFSGRTRAGMRGLRVLGNKATTPVGVLVSLTNCTDCYVERCQIEGANGTGEGSILLNGSPTGCRVVDNVILDCGATAIGLTGVNCTGNVVERNQIERSVLFGVRSGGGAHGNTISYNKTGENGLELIGITGDSYENRVIGNHAYGCGDNGISVSGYRNTVVGNECLYNYGAGIWVWGAGNTVTGNVCLSNNQSNSGNNWAGIGVSANYGGTGQFNTITGNTCDDDQAVPTQFNGVRSAGVSYLTWAAGVAVTQGNYRTNGLHIYFATTTGTTGATAPTHTSGTVSDGGVSWRYVRSFMGLVASSSNVVSSNTSGRHHAGGARYFDTTGWTLNTLVDSAGFGSYTPTVTGIANTAAVSASACRWIRTGNLVTVFFNVSVTPVAATLTTARVSLPIPASFGGATAATGSGSSSLGNAVDSYADAGSGEVVLRFYAASTNVASLRGSFVYVIAP